VTGAFDEIPPNSLERLEVEHAGGIQPPVIILCFEERPHDILRLLLAGKQCW
jgi:hypothetical protein